MTRRRSEIRHGTSNGYQTYRCKCEECRAWKRAENAKRSTKKELKVGNLRTKNDKLYRWTGTRWRRSVKTNCANCDKEIVVDYFKHNRELANRYCGSSCGNHARWDGPIMRVAIWCVICKRPRLVKRSQRERYKTCGRDHCKYLIKRRNALRRWRANDFATKV